MALAVGGVEDHVHLLVGLRTTQAVADITRELKKASSNWVTEKWDREFGWQEGYAAFSVSATHIDPVRDYIARQEKHHAKVSFVDELKRILERNGVAYDPRFLA
jgi:REP element-mobilizing transposase RayT